MRKASGACLLVLLLGGPALFAAVVGPDAFGYTATDETAYSFVDISRTGIRALAGTDDATAVAGLGFTFSFYGQNFTSACISANGYLTFNGCADAFANQDLGATPTPGGLPIVAPYWTDLTFMRPNADAAYYQTLGAAPNRQFVVQWNSAFPQNAAQPVTVQAVLYETSNAIRFQYAKVDVGAGDRASNGGQATVGICNAGGRTTGQCIPWSFNAAVIRANTAILVSPRPASARDATAALIMVVKGSGIPANIQHELVVTLEAAIAAFDRNNQTAAIQQIQAFENKVRAQQGKAIDQATADRLIGAAAQIIK